MKIIIIGNGVAGTFSAQNIRNRDDDVEIHIYSEEKYNYYTRIKLPEIISERLTIEDLIVFKDTWYKNKKIKVHLKSKIREIDPENKTITLENNNEKVSYDKLILATGSLPNVPPIKNAKEMIGKGEFTLRSIEDAYEIRNYIKEKNCKKAIIIGGGLLGLELSRQIKNCGLDTRVIEYFPRLLPRQLDPDCGDMLKDEIEDMGIKVDLDAKTDKIIGKNSVKGVALKNNTTFDADIILIQAGVTPKIDLAKEANLETNKGIIVNNHLETNANDIYAVGDCIEYDSQTWGIIPACVEQSKIIAASVLGNKEEEYEGTTPQTTLKIVGIDLTSVGVYDPSEELGGGWQILKKSDRKNKCYKKIVLKDNKLKGAILFGEKSGTKYIQQNINAEVNPKEVRKEMDMRIYKCSSCGAEYDEAEKEIPFDELPADWKCQNCGAPKDGFEEIL
ncbi:MAG: FAD-dependent oxidoreductase [Candidatus Lokiarchaeota archaeon]